MQVIGTAFVDDLDTWLQGQRAALRVAAGPAPADRTTWADAARRVAEPFMPDFPVFSGARVEAWDKNLEHRGVPVEAGTAPRPMLRVHLEFAGGDPRLLKLRPGDGSPTPPATVFERSVCHDFPASADRGEIGAWRDAVVRKVDRLRHAVWLLWGSGVTCSVLEHWNTVSNYARDSKRALADAEEDARALAGLFDAFFRTDS